MITIEINGGVASAHGDIIPGQVIDVIVDGECYRVTRWGKVKAGCHEKDSVLPDLHEARSEGLA